MNISKNDLKIKMSEITGLLFTHPTRPGKKATEIWIKFRQSGYYAFIDFEQPFPEIIELQKLIGKGNSLNCSDDKKDNNLIQYNLKNEVLEILDESKNYKWNIPDTVEQTEDLFSNFKARHLY
tara:strand:+ start:3318 stop:3686 length:369 start_codon:yes stop_codon:yes gene_type:complete